MQKSFEPLYQPFSGHLDRFVTLDTETTGFAKDDEVLQIGIVDQNGNKLVDSLVKPTIKKRWPYAEKVHNITPQMVAKNGVSYHEAIEQTAAVLKNFDNVVIYNASYDTRFFPQNFFKGKNVFCAMQLSIPFLREHPSYDAPTRFIKLMNLAVLFKLKIKDIELHSAAGDAELTRRIWQHFLDTKHQLDTPLENIIGEWLFYQGIGCAE